MEAATLNDISNFNTIKGYKMNIIFYRINDKTTDTEIGNSQNIFCDRLH